MKRKYKMFEMNFTVISYLSKTGLIVILGVITWIFVNLHTADGRIAFNENNRTAAVNVLLRTVLFRS